jgi:Putative beta-barrel porin 2
MHRQMPNKGGPFERRVEMNCNAAMAEWIALTAPTSCQDHSKCEVTHGFEVIAKQGDLQSQPPPPSPLGHHHQKIGDSSVGSCEFPKIALESTNPREREFGRSLKARWNLATWSFSGASALRSKGVMIRGGTLTLGAVLILDGISGARGDDLSSLVDVTPNAASLWSQDGVFPRLPENWSDLPVQFKLSESVGYNSNVLGFPTNIPLSGALARGDFQSISSYGASTKFYLGGQQLFADVSFGLTRYLHDVRLNSIQNAVDAGVNWAYNSRCSGKLIASESVAPSTLFQQIASGSTAGSPFAHQATSGSTAASTSAQQTASGSAAASVVPQQIASTTNNIVSTTGFNETARCLVSGDYAVVLNSGVTRSSNSTLVNGLNDDRSVFLATGISYNVTAEDSLELLATITGTDYANRPATLGNLGLANSITEDQISLIYTRQIDPNLSVNASIGAVGVNNSPFTLVLPSKILPQYSASVTWAATSKVSLTASVGRTVTPPQAVIGNAQITEYASFGLEYQFSPKVAFSASISSAYASSTFTQLGSTVPNGVPTYALSALNSFGASAGLAYNMTPFLAADVTYQYSRSTQSSVFTPESLLILTVTYNPY